MKVICYSSFTFSYLNRARVLFASLRRHHPDWWLVALVTDLPPPAFTWAADEPFDELVYADQLGIPEFSSWLFKHDIIEVCTAVKGPYLHQACASGADAVVYLDPDTCLFENLNPMLALLEDWDVVLTPHLTEPETELGGIMDNEISALRSGIYNLGFVAIRTRGEGARFAQWWNERLLSFCYDDIPEGLFVDQRWCDHVPALFDKVKVLRDPGYNVASWNVSKRRVTIGRDGVVRSNGVPLRFWHFTKLGAIGDAMTKRYAKDNFEVYELWRWYRRQVEEATSPEVPGGYWAYGAYKDGEAINKPDRVLYRKRRDLQDAFPDPFLSGPGGFQAWRAVHASADR